MPIFFEIPKLQFTPIFEYRGRVERRLEPDFSDAVYDDRTVFEQRFRAGLNYDGGKGLTGEFRYQYSHEWFFRESGNNSHDSSDVFLAHLDLKRKEGTYSLGRQIINKGDRRLFDVSNFSQRPKSFDVVRFRNNKWDLWAGQVGTTSSETDYSKLIGAWYASRAGETLGVWKRDDGDPDMSHFTIDQRKVFSLGSNTSLDLEGAYQFGEIGGKDQKAFWLHGRATRPLNAKTGLYAEVNVASGGQSATESNTFDPLYGTSHANYGLMDLQGLRNVKQIELGLTSKLSPRLSGLVSFNKYWLYDKTDGWYSGGSIARRPGGRFVDPTGKAGDDVGNEFNLSLDYTINKTSGLTLELGLFKPGSFVETLVGPSPSDQLWGLLSYNARF
jgi:hypothetical protein